MPCSAGEPPRSTRNVRDHVIVQMGTMSPALLGDLEREVIAAGGRYVEAPVSGSRRPGGAGARWSR